MRRVSTPADGGDAAAGRASASRCWLLRQLEASVIGARTTMPAGIRGGRLDILVVGAHIADMRKREGDDLAGIGRIGQDLLVAGDRRVEDELALMHAGTAATESEKDRAVRERERGVRAGAGREWT